MLHEHSHTSGHAIQKTEEMEQQCISTDGNAFTPLVEQTQAGRYVVSFRQLLVVILRRNCSHSKHCSDFGGCQYIPEYKVEYLTCFLRSFGRWCALGLLLAASTFQIPNKWINKSTPPEVFRGVSTAFRQRYRSHSAYKKSARGSLPLAHGFTITCKLSAS